MAGKGKKDWMTLYLLIGLAGMLLLNIIIILRGTTEAFNSDSATAILLAKEQMRTGQIIPAGWHYANDVWLLSLNLFCIPFLLFLDNWLLCRDLAVILQMLVVTGLLIAFVRKLVDLKWALLAAIVFWCPISSVVQEHFLYQATYATIIGQTLLILFLTYGFFEAHGKRPLLLYGAMLGILTIVLTAGGIRLVGSVILPILAAYGLMLLSDKDFDVKSVLCDKGSKLFLGKMAYFLAMCVVGYFLHLKIRATGVISNYTMSINPDKSLWTGLGELLDYYMDVWGCLEISQIISVSGVLGFCRFLVFFFMNFVAPIYACVRYRRLASQRMRFFVLYAFFAAAITDYLIVFTDMCNSYYLLPVYFNGCILSVILIHDLSGRGIRFKNISLLLAAVCAVPFCLLTGVYHAKAGYADGAVDRALLETLKENELSFGCSGIFWDTYKYTVLSNGEVEIISYIDMPETPNLWLTSEQWYQPEYHQGRSFILTRMGWETVPDVWKERAEDVIHCGEFVIYVYSQNIYQIIADEP